MSWNSKKKMLESDGSRQESARNEYHRKDYKRGLDVLFQEVEQLSSTSRLNRLAPERRGKSLFSSMPVNGL